MKCFTFLCKKTMRAIPIYTDLEGAKKMLDELRSFVDKASAVAEAVPVPAVQAGATALDKALDAVDNSV